MITLAQEAAKRAGDILRASFGRSSLNVRSKGPSDYVTDLDRRAEDAIRELIESELPDHGFLLEESGAARPGAEYEWIVDPLDGTTNYIHRYPFFSVSIALRHRGRMALGVVLDPLRNEMFTAEAGEPARLNGVEVRVSATPRLDEALVCTGFPFRVRHELDRYLACFREVFLGSAGMRRDGSAALDLAYVACGRFDAFWELGLSPWDIAAGSLLVECAGGKVSDFHGGPGALEGGDVIASNGRVHDAIEAVTRQVFAGGRPR